MSCGLAGLCIGCLAVAGQHATGCMVGPYSKTTTPFANVGMEILNRVHRVLPSCLVGWLPYALVALQVDQGGLTLPSEVVYQNSVYTNYVSRRPDCKNTSANLSQYIH